MGGVTGGMMGGMGQGAVAVNATTPFYPLLARCRVRVGASQGKSGIVRAGHRLMPGMGGELPLVSSCGSVEYETGAETTSIQDMETQFKTKSGAIAVIQLVISVNLE